MSGDHFFIDVWREATASYWNRRAEEFEAIALPRASDFTGQATPEEQFARWRRCQETAKACRARVTLSFVSGAEFLEALVDVGGSPDRLDEAEANCRRAIDRGDITAIRYWERVIDRLEAA